MSSIHKKPLSFLDYLYDKYGDDFDVKTWSMIDMDEYLLKNKSSAIIMVFNDDNLYSLNSVDFIVKNMKNALTPEIAYLFRSASDYIMSEIEGPQKWDLIH